MLTPEAQELFKALDNEYTNAMGMDQENARLEPAVSQTDPKWSLSQWSKFNLTQIFPQTAEGTADNDNQKAQPVEITNLEQIFPGFYASIPEKHLN